MHLPEGILEALRREVEPAYLLDRAGRIVFINDAWDRVARAQAAPASAFSDSVLGTRWVDGIHGRVRRYYAALLERAFSLPAADRPVALIHLSECNTPVLARTLATRFVPLRAEEEATPRWVLLLHSIVAETPIGVRHPISDHANSEGGLERYRDDDGCVTQCGCCRRTRLSAERRWELVPFLVRSVPEEVRWGLCRACFESWYGPPQLQLLEPTRRGLPNRATGAWGGATRSPTWAPQR